MLNKLKLFEEMSKALTDKVMANVGKRLLEDQKIGQQQLTQLLEKRMEQFDKDVRESVNKITKEEFEGFIRGIVRNELSKWWGEFNDVLESNEKFGGKLVNSNRTKHLWSCINKCSLIDLGFKDFKYT